MKYLKQTLLCLTALAAASSTWALRINEIRVDNVGDDTDEYAELKGEPAESLDNVWYLVLGDHSGENASKGSGTVEFAINLTGFTIGNDGYFLIGSDQMTLVDPLGTDIDYYISVNNFENSDNVTHLLVREYTGPEVLSITDQLGDLAVDIDDNDNGIPNETLPWSAIIDAIGLVETPDEGEFFYGEILGFTDIGPDGIFVPGHVYRYEDSGVWQIGTFNPMEFDTPRAPNPSEPTLPSITSFSPNYGPAETVVTLTGTKLDSLTSLTVGGVEATYTVTSSTEIEITVPATATYGGFEVTNSSGSAASTQNFIVVPEDATFVVEENFTTPDSLGVFTATSLASDKNWGYVSFGDDTYVEMNGYDNGEDTASDDWLISPAIDLTDISSSDTAFLHFTSAANFSGPDLEILVSSDYTGSGDPSAATWSAQTATLSDGGYVLTDSGIIDLSSYAGESIYIAFRYTSLGSAAGEGKTYQIYQVLVVAAGEPTSQPGNPWAGQDHTTDGWTIASFGTESHQSFWLNDTLYPWIYTPEHSWLYVHPEGNAIYLYNATSTLGWMTILPEADVSYPYLYVYTLGGWSYYHADDGDPSNGRWFYRFESPVGWISILP